MAESTVSAEKEEIIIKNTFLSGKSRQEAEGIFLQRRKHQFLKIFGAPQEKIGTIEERSRPLGIFTFQEITSQGHIHQRRLFVDLNSAEIYSIKGAELAKNPLLRRILELPPEIHEDLLHLIEHKSLDCDNFSKKHLAILEKKGLIYISRQKKKSLLLSLVDHILEILTAVTDVGGEVLGMKPTKLSHRESKESDKVMVHLESLKLNRTHDLNFYLAVAETGRTLQEFKQDEINYQPNEIITAIKTFLSSDSAINFEGVACLPYYRCHYLNHIPRESFIFPLKFKSFISHFAEIKHFWLYNLIDKAPEVPFFILALLYVAYLYPQLEQITLIFSSSLIFVLLALVIGIGLKLLLKRERKVPYFINSIMRYGFPSLHSLTSLGTATFVYFIPGIGPFFCCFFLLLGLVYAHSRLQLQVHSLTDVVGGALIGLLLGGLCGYFLLSQNVLALSSPLQVLLTALFFIFPIFSILYRVRVEHLV